MTGAPTTQPSSVTALVGETLWGTWRVDRHLITAGAVSFFEVTGLGGRPAVLHVLDPAASRDEAHVARFVREGRISRLVSHPRIVAALDEQRTEGGAVCVVFERLVGFSCDQIARSRPAGRLDAGEVALVAEQALEALCALHQKNMLHAAITPQNLFWTEDRGLVLAGLGGARPFGSERRDLAAPGAEDASLLPFMAPEQVLGDHRRLDARTDLWALGATLFFLLSGRTVRDGGVGPGPLLAAMSQRPPSIETLVPDVPPDLEALIDVALAMRQEDRWRTAAETLTALRSFRSPTVRTVALPAGATSDNRPGATSDNRPGASGNGSGASSGNGSGASSDNGSGASDNGPSASSDSHSHVPVRTMALPAGVPDSRDAGAQAPPSGGAGVDEPSLPAEVVEYAAMKAIEWSSPASLPEALEKRGTDAVTFRVIELSLFGHLSRGSLAERVRAAEALHDALREATRTT